MDSHVETAMEYLEQGIREYAPIADPTVLAEETWNELSEAVDMGYLTFEDAEEMFFQWFNSHS